MARGLFPGMTNYSDQSLSDIAEDIRSWIKCCEKTKTKFETNIAAIKKDGLWDSTIPYDFQTFCLNTPLTCDTYINDFNNVLKSVEADHITSTEIHLMNNLYKTAQKNENWCVEAYKYSGPRGWCKFGAPEFAKIEELYSEGRNFYINMFDIDNVTTRMKDYMKVGTVIVDKSTHTDQSINFGDQSTVNITGNNAQLGSNINKEEKKTICEKILLPFLITIIGGVVVTLICFYLNIN